MKVLIMFCLMALLQAQSTDLDRYLKGKGYHLTPAGTPIDEGYISPKQREMFIEELKKLSGIQKIAEVGFNAGHTSEIFLEFVKNSQVVSFDINRHYYTQAGVGFIQSKYKERFRFVEGDSLQSINEFSQTHPEERFDLIYIDGCHLFAVCLDDILNFRKMAHSATVLWIDDSDYIDVQRAVELAERLRIIQVVQSFVAEDDLGVRAWVEARYLLPAS
jgi:hypothetical protein